MEKVNKSQKKKKKKAKSIAVILLAGLEKVTALTKRAGVG